MSRIFGPLRENHPLLIERCVLCDEPFAIGDRTTLVPTTIASPEGEETGYYDRRLVDGRWQTAECFPVHAVCAEQTTERDE